LHSVGNCKWNDGNEGDGEAYDLLPSRVVGDAVFCSIASDVDSGSDCLTLRAKSAFMLDVGRIL
jgi:hypothetical protein